MKKAVLAATLFLFIVAGSWIIAVPERLIIGRIEDSMADNLSLRTEGFRKGLFYNFSVERVSLVKKTKFGRDADPSDAPLLVLDEVRARIEPLSLLRLNPELHFACSLQGGSIEGEAGLLAGGAIRMNGRNIPLEGIPFLETFGLRGDGMVSGELRLEAGKGEAKVSVDRVKLQNSSLGNFYLPLGFFHTIRGLVTLQDKTILLRSFAFQGEGVYARAKGEVAGRNVNVTLEVTADSSFKAGPALQTMLERYTVSPGYYLIPIKTELPQ